jgi:hypothetical protein
VRSDRPANRAFYRKDYPEKLRRVKYHGQERKKTFVFLTNNMGITAPQAAILAEEFKSARSTFEILHVIGISILDKTPVNELLKNIDYKVVIELTCNQLSLSSFNWTAIMLNTF